LSIYQNEILLYHQIYQNCVFFFPQHYVRACGMHKAHVCGDVVVTHVFDLQVLFEDYIHNKNEKEKKNIMKEKDRGRGTKTLP
jgi:hypothetical protein